MLPRQRGYTLLETIIGLFLLTMGALLVSRLFHASLQRSRWSDQEHISRVVAERKLAEIRAWAAGGGFMSEADLSTYDGQRENDPDHPDYQVTVSARLSPVTSPCSGLENFAASRELARSCAIVELTVSWSSGELRLVSLVGQSERVLETVEVRGEIPDPVSPTTSFELDAVALDSDGQEIEDVAFAWWVEAIDGNATIQPLGDTSSARVTNQTQWPDGTTYINDGTCRIGARARYAGKEVTGYSGTVNLAP
ncbi:MAG: prepilin-type N-terminal cleavage/methylation domain-containing protein [Armatimonadetes bacterium]|nr:prepilin-type N-terminal cleavage/methylation domain-containing protein [Armatimonadota bacterium]